MRASPTTSFTRTRLEIRMVSLAAALGHAALDNWDIAEHVLQQIGVRKHRNPVATVAELFSLLRVSWRKAAATEDSRRWWLAQMETVLLKSPEHVLEYVGCVEPEALPLHERLALLRKAHDAAETDSMRTKIAAAIDRAISAPGSEART